MEVGATVAFSRDDARWLCYLMTRGTFFLFLVSMWVEGLVAIGGGGFELATALDAMG